MARKRVSPPTAPLTVNKQEANKEKKTKKNANVKKEQGEISSTKNPALRRSERLKKVFENRKDDEVENQAKNEKTNVSKNRNRKKMENKLKENQNETLEEVSSDSFDQAENENKSVDTSKDVDIYASSVEKHKFAYLKLEENKRRRNVINIKFDKMQTEITIYKLKFKTHMLMKQYQFGAALEELLADKLITLEQLGLKYYEGHTCVRSFFLEIDEIYQNEMEFYLQEISEEDRKPLFKAKSDYHGFCISRDTIYPDNDLLEAEMTETSRFLNYARELACVSAVKREERHLMEKSSIFEISYSRNIDIKFAVDKTSCEDYKWLPVSKNRCPYVRMDSKLEIVDEGEVHVSDEDAAVEIIFDEASRCCPI